jgi:hypothetical protein
MIVIFDLKLFKPIFEISTSSIKIFPSYGSIILNNDNIIVDFPDPDLPTIPFFFFFLILK